MNGEITYTFSTALRMMRYGGKKMRYIESDIVYFCNGFNELRYINSDGYIGIAVLSSTIIMGSWVEVQDEKH
jgi:hypothetical protein